MGGFHGAFTAPEAKDLKLRQGLLGRITYRDGRILKIEVAEAAVPHSSR